MDQLTNCPWAPWGQLPVHYCETNLCAWVVQPANTWSNIGYLIAAFYIYRQTEWKPVRKQFAFASLFLFAGSSFYHLSGTFIGRDIDVGAMLLLSSLVLMQTFSRTVGKRFEFSALQIFWMTIGLFGLSLPSLRGFGPGGGVMFVAQIFVAALLELVYYKKNHSSREVKKSFLVAIALFAVAMVLNLLDMTRTFCLPENNIITLHAIWHLMCAYSIFLGVKYFCHPEKT